MRGVSAQLLCALMASSTLGLVNAHADVKAVRPRMPMPDDEPEDPCDRPCPKVLFWVCGSDNVTYTNECSLEIAHCKNETVELAYEGMCKRPPGDDGGSWRIASEPCQTSCTVEYKPVCGTDGLTYASACVLETFKCFREINGLEVAYNGECKPEDKAQCSEHPCGHGVAVCGTDGISQLRPFDSDCQLHKEACLKNKAIIPVENVQCLLPTNEPSTPPPPPPAEKCDIVCTADYSPVCGSDGNTYSNACHLTAAACRDPSANIQKASEGECPSTDPNAAALLEDQSSGPSVGVIVGSVFGVIAALALAAGGIFMWRRREQAKRHFQVMRGIDEEFEESDSEHSLDVNDMHARAAAAARLDESMDSTYAPLPRNGV